MSLAWVAGAVLLLVLLYAGLRWFVSARPSELAQAARTFVAVFSALASTGLIFAGRFGLALITVAATVMAARAVLLSRRGADPIGEAGQDAAGGAAEVETGLLAMRLDRRTGRIDGEIRRGPLKGARLSRLGLEAVLRLLDEARVEDPPSVDLLEAYLDRREPSWRGRTEAGTGPSSPPPSNSGAMDEATALGILGLASGATEDEVKAAHRRLMARLHPDLGGSTYLASQINQAKDVLLGRERRRGAAR
jgi:hypothetical protein